MNDLLCIIGNRLDECNCCSCKSGFCAKTTDTKEEVAAKQQETTVPVTDKPATQFNEGRILASPLAAL